MAAFADIIRSGNPLVSCVVPVFNKSPYLRESVESLLGQEYQHLEIIVVDDQSTDDSAAVGAALAQANPGRVRFLTKRNGGISDTRNLGLSEAKGPLALCLDGDDLADRTFISKAIDLMRRDGANLVCSDVELFGAETGEWIPEPYDPYYLRYNNSIPTLCLFDRELWVKAGGYKVAIPFAEDWEFFVNCTRYDLNAKKIPEKLFRYRRTKEGLLTNYLKDKWQEPVSIVMLANADLYNIKDIEFAQGAIIKGGASWHERFAKQDQLHPKEWLLKFVLGLFKESSADYQGALEFYAAAAQMTSFKNWLPILRIAQIVEHQGNDRAASDLFHQVRILRPDMNFMIGEKANLRNVAKS